MKILAVDTSSKVLAIGIAYGDKVADYNVEVATGLSSLLVPSIKRIMDNLGWQMKDIDFFACGQGPGSFTGVRVGMSAVKALAWSLKKPIAAVSSLDILSKNAAGACDFIIPVIDAKRGLVYAAIYTLNKGVLKRISGDMLLAPEDLSAKVKKHIPESPKAKVLFLGDGLASYKEKIKSSIKWADFLDRDHWYVAGRNIIALAKEKIKKGRLETAFSISPVYLYPKECQIRKIKK
jgi:tRNA threonylcarbamoyladenosine biosynthesis protein TsaB